MDDARRRILPPTITYTEDEVSSSSQRGRSSV
jgi:hypothetical protein